MSLATLQAGSETAPVAPRALVRVASAWVQVELRHDVPIFLPGLQYVPGVGTCDALGCYIRLTTATQFRMEPEP